VDLFWIVVLVGLLAELAILGAAWWVMAIRFPAVSLGRSTGTRPSRRFAWQLTIEGIVGSAAVYWFLTHGLGLSLVPWQ